MEINHDLEINLAGIPEERWRESEERCAVCRRFLDEIEETVDIEDDCGCGHVPLLLWRKDGQEMLRICWPCARKRIGAAPTMSGAE